MYKYIKFPNFKLKALTLSYDDGVRQDKRLISIMEKYNIKGTFNINGGMFSTEYDGVEKGRMTRQEAIDLYASPNAEVALHGYKHYSLGDVATNLAINDIVADRKELESMFGCVINGMAFANGSYNNEILDILSKLGIKWARRTGQSECFELPNNWLEWRGTCHHDNPRLMELAKIFVESQEQPYYWGNNLQLFYIWGHSFEFDNNHNWDKIESFAQYVGGRKDIWYATNSEIFEYLQACERLEFSADGSFVKNPSSIDVYIDFLYAKRIVPAGKTIKIVEGAEL